MTRKKSAKDTVIDYILSKIQDGTLKPGDRIISERTMGEELHLSRVPIREAISTLTSIGILESFRGNGTYVAGFNPDKVIRIINMHGLLGCPAVDDILQMRRNFEPDVARMAAANRTDDDLLRITIALNQYEDAVYSYFNREISLAEMVRVNDAFHLEIARATQNRFIAQMFEMAIGITFYRLRDREDEFNLNIYRSAQELHVHIKDAIMRHDEKAAYQYMQKHVQSEL